MLGVDGAAEEGTVVHLETVASPRTHSLQCIPLWLLLNQPLAFLFFQLLLAVAAKVKAVYPWTLLAH